MPRVDRRLARFMLRAALVWALLLAPWPGLGGAFTRAFDATANALVGWVQWRGVPAQAIGTVLIPGSKAVTFEVDFRTVAEAQVDPARIAPNAYSVPSPSWYSIIRVRNTDTGEQMRIAICLRELVYVPLAIFVSLTAAAPMAPRRRDWARSVALGAALSLAFVVIGVLVPFVAVLANDRVGVLAFGPSANAWLQTAFTTLAETASAIAIVLWLVARWVAIRDGNWLWLDGSTPPESPRPGLAGLARASRPLG